VKTMILKELKWNLKWALIGCAAWTLCLAGYAMNWFFDQTRTYENLLSLEVQAVTFVGFPAFGFLLGFLQIFFESRRDAWAFLVHRPLSRRDIFWSKVIAGLLLYFAAFLIPALVFLGWLLLPKELPIPFEWRVALPALSDFLSGMVCYFAGLLVGLRQARWCGSRLWPVLTAALLLFLLLSLMILPLDDSAGPVESAIVQLIWLVISAMLIVLALAVYGAFMAGGAFSRQPRICKWALGLNLMLAGAFLFAFCWLFLGEFVANVMDSLQVWSWSKGAENCEVLRFPAKEWSSDLRVTKDGRVVTVVSMKTNPLGQVPWQNSSSGPRITAILDELGKPMEEYKNYVGEELFNFTYETLHLISLDSILWSPSSHYGHRDQEAPFERVWTNEDKTISWFFYPRHGRFFGYSLNWRTDAPLSYTPLGSAGPDGFQSSSAKSQLRFPAPVNPRQKIAPLYHSESDIYWIDFQSSQVQLVFSAPKGEFIVRSGNYPDSLRQHRTQRGGGASPVEPEKEKDIYLLTSGNHLVFINRDKGVLADINLVGVLDPDDVVNAGRALDKGLYFLETKERMIAFFQDGRIQAQYKLPSEPPSRGLPLYAYRSENTWETVCDCLKRLALPIAAPPVFFLALRVIRYAEHQCNQRFLAKYNHRIPPDSNTAWKLFLVESWYAIGPSLAAALLALLFCNRRLRKYPFSRGEKITWRLLMLLMGPGALLALYALYDWPAKEPCPACGKMRVVNRENCEFCGAPFTPPAPTGKEMFGNDE